MLQPQLHSRWFCDMSTWRLKSYKVQSRDGGYTDRNERNCRRKMFCATGDRHMLLPLTDPYKRLICRRCYVSANLQFHLLHKRQSYLDLQSGSVAGTASREITTYLLSLFSSNSAAVLGSILHPACLLDWLLEAWNQFWRSATNIEKFGPKCAIRGRYWL
jgi:hypothetical protein